MKNSDVAAQESRHYAAKPISSRELSNGNRLSEETGPFATNGE
jgi:hypothetical protein